MASCDPVCVFALCMDHNAGRYCVRECAASASVGAIKEFS
jgi:hypothetical protein